MSARRRTLEVVLDIPADLATQLTYDVEVYGVAAMTRLSDGSLQRVPPEAVVISDLPVVPDIDLSHRTDLSEGLRRLAKGIWPGVKMLDLPPLPPLNLPPLSTEDFRRNLRNHVPSADGCGKMTGVDQHPTTEVPPMSQIDDLQLRILDVLIEHDGYFSADFGQVLVTLAQEAFGDEDIRTGERQYHQTSIAVLRLEQVGFVTVDRAYRDEAEKANVITGIRLL